jgi:hypothetical protein
MRETISTVEHASASILGLNEAAAAAFVTRPPYFSGELG